jgi:hypothetical protein
MAAASDIREHMDVISSDRKIVGKVDHMEGADKIKLTKTKLSGRQASFHSVGLGGSCRPACPPQQIRRRRDVTVAVIAIRRRIGVLR